MKLCINCQNFCKDTRLCITSANGWSPIDGKINPKIAIVERSENPTATCGVEGKNFKPFPPAPKLSELIGTVDYEKTTTTSPSGFVSILHQYWSRIFK